MIGPTIWVPWTTVGSSTTSAVLFPRLRGRARQGALEGFFRRVCVTSGKFTSSDNYKARRSRASGLVDMGDMCVQPRENLPLLTTILVYSLDSSGAELSNERLRAVRILGLFEIFSNFVCHGSLFFKKKKTFMRHAQNPIK